MIKKKIYNDSNNFIFGIKPFICSVNHNCHEQRKGYFSI